MPLTPTRKIKKADLVKSAWRNQLLLAAGLTRLYDTRRISVSLRRSHGLHGSGGTRPCARPHRKQRAVIVGSGR